MILFNQRTLLDRPSIVQPRVKTTRGFPGAVQLFPTSKSGTVLVAICRFAGPTASKVLFTACSRVGNRTLLYPLPISTMEEERKPAPGEIDTFLPACATHVHEANRRGVLHSFGDGCDDCSLRSFPTDNPQPDRRLCRTPRSVSPNSACLPKDEARRARTG